MLWWLFDLASAARALMYSLKERWVGRKRSDGQRERMRVKCCGIDAVDGGGGGTTVVDAALATDVADAAAALVVVVVISLEVDVAMEESFASLIGIWR